MKNNDKLIKMFLVFFVYFFYTMYASSIFGTLGINNTVITSFIADILFMLFVVFMYRHNLKEDIKKFKKYSLKKILSTIILWVVIIIAFNIVYGMLLDFIAPGFENTDANTAAVYNLYSVSGWYTIFKTMIFGTLAEEILYRESVRDNVKNNILYVLLSAGIYTFMNVIFSGLVSGFEIVSIIAYFLPGIFFSIAYIRNDNNILLLSLVKICYNLIPLTVLLLGLAA